MSGKIFYPSCITESIQGFSHKLKQIENEDACKVKYGVIKINEGKELPYMIVSVADGHGDKKVTRAKRGAEIAVETSISVIKREIKGLFQSRDESKDRRKRYFEDTIVKGIIKEWRQSVKRDFEKPDSGNIKEFTDLEIYKIYGTTLIAVLLTPEFIFYFQLGDGSILRLGKNGEVKEIFETSNEFLGNETASLSLSRPEHYAKVKYEPEEKLKNIEMLMITTDGYPNSFRTDDDYFKTIKDYHSLLKEKGEKYVKENIKTWLEETSKEGSGDDITVVLVYDFFKRPPHIIWLVDCSDSMRGDKINRVNEIIKKAILKIKEMSERNSFIQFLIGAVKFSDTAEWCKSEPVPVEQFQWEDLTPGRGTAMGEALSLVADALKPEKIGKVALPPVLILLSDGEPTDNFEGGLNKLLSERWGKKAIRIAIAIGEYAEKEYLKEFVSNPEYLLEAKNTANIPQLVNTIKNILIKEIKSQLEISDLQKNPIPREHALILKQNSNEIGKDKKKE